MYFIYRANLISIDEMISVMQNLQAVPDETKLNTIMSVLDADQDGVIDISDAIEVRISRRRIKICSIFQSHYF